MSACNASVAFLVSAAGAGLSAALAAARWRTLGDRAPAPYEAAL